MLKFVWFFLNSYACRSACSLTLYFTASHHVYSPTCIWIHVLFLPSWFHGNCPYFYLRPTPFTCAPDHLLSTQRLSPPRLIGFLSCVNFFLSTVLFSLAHLQKKCCSFSHGEEKQIIPRHQLTPILWLKLHFSVLCYSKIIFTSVIYIHYVQFLSSFLLNTLPMPHSPCQQSVLSPQSIPICSSRAGGHTLGAFGLVCMTGQSLTSLRSLLKCHLLTQAFSDLLLKTSTHPHHHESPSSFTQIYHISPKYVTYFVLSIFPQWTEVPMRAGTLCIHCCIPSIQPSTAQGMWQALYINWLNKFYWVWKSEMI